MSPPPASYDPPADGWSNANGPAPVLDTRSASITAILNRLDSGEREWAGDLLPIVYDELHGLAEGIFRSERRGHTLQPTALVHEAYMKLARSDSSFENRAHFCAVAATAMRQVLISHARAKAAQRRAPEHGGRVDLTLEIPAGSGPSVVDLMTLDDALTRLAELDSDLARLVELRFFGGLTVEEIGAIQGVARTTVTYRWRLARAWLTREFGQAGAS